MFNNKSQVKSIHHAVNLNCQYILCYTSIFYLQLVNKVITREILSMNRRQVM